MSTSEVITTFSLIEFNRVRYARDKPAAKVQVYEDGEPQGFLWMDVDDLRANIRDHGACEAFEQGLKSYGETI